MGTSPLYQKLQAVADDFVCGDWGSPMVLSPQRHMEKADRDLALQPEVLTELRRVRATGKWAMVFIGRRVKDARGGPVESAIDAIISFSPEEVRRLTPHAIRRELIGVIIEREMHEVLEQAQLRSATGRPIVNPHHWSDDLAHIVKRAAVAVLDHSAI